ncbi:AMP-binding enzyme [Yinghuangia aomiensis]
MGALEVEEALLALPGVAEAAVVAAPGPRLGEHAAAFLRMRPGTEPPCPLRRPAHPPGRRSASPGQKRPEKSTARIQDFQRREQQGCGDSCWRDLFGKRGKMDSRDRKSSRAARDLRSSGDADNHLYETEGADQVPPRRYRGAIEYVQVRATKIAIRGQISSTSPTGLRGRRAAPWRSTSGSATPTARTGRRSSASRCARSRRSASRPRASP